MVRARVIPGAATIANARPARATPERASAAREATTSARRVHRALGARRAESARADEAPREIRLYGLNACLAAFAKRPEALRKVYLTEARIPALKPVLAWCVKHRLGYRVVEDADLDKLTSSRHHEGVCFEMLRAPPLELGELLAAQPKAPDASLLLWLDGVGNPHNLGALLRSAAHFGVAGVIVPDTVVARCFRRRRARRRRRRRSSCRSRAPDCAARATRCARTATLLAATVPRDGEPLYDAVLPPRLVLVFGAEGEGMSSALIESADLRITIPGSGAIESLNVAASVAVVLGEYWRQRHARTHARMSAANERRRCRRRHFPLLRIAGTTSAR